MFLSAHQKAREMLEFQGADCFAGPRLGRHGMTPENQPSTPDTGPNLPTWKELTEFINAQAEKDRKVIDFWFKLAAALLGFVLFIATLVGFKTLSDAKAAAEIAAREAARAKVEEVLKQPEIQHLVETTASDLFSRGVFRNEIEARVRELLPGAIAGALQNPEFHQLIADGIKRELITMRAGRVLTEAQRKRIVESLLSGPGGQVRVLTGALEEQQAYATKLYQAIMGAPLWKDHVSYAAAGSFAGMTNYGILLEGIAIVVKDTMRPPDSARLLEGALKNAGVPNIRIQTCGCDSPPKPADIWLYIGEKQ
jgi:hypothetical protein